MRFKDIFLRREPRASQAASPRSRGSSTFPHHSSASHSTIAANIGQVVASPQSGSLENGSSSAIYWARAASKLRLKQPNVANTMVELQTQSSSAHGDIIESLGEEIKLRRKELEPKRWKFKFGTKIVVLREQLSKISKAGQAFKDLVGPLAGLDPIHAGLPWAGICFLMQLTIGDTDQFAATVSAAEEVSEVIKRYKHVEYICQRREDIGLRPEFEAILVKLYKHILGFQISAAC